MAQFGLGQSKMFPQLLRVRLAEEGLPFSEPEDLEWRSIEAAAVFASNTTLV
jgi:hypothetical protein